MGSTTILFGLGTLAIVGWILAEVIGNLNPKIAGIIKLMVALLAIGMVVDQVVTIFEKVKGVSKGLM